MSRLVRDKYTKEERIEMIKNKPVNQNMTRIAKYLSQDNVKAYNRTLVDTAFKRPLNYDRIILNDMELLESETIDYFKLCDNYDIIPTITNYCLYIGITTETFYQVPKVYNHATDFLQKVLLTIRSYQEPAVLDGSVATVPWLFMAKNYYGMSDNSTTTINIQAPNTNEATLKVIQEQIALENSQNNPNNDD